MHGPRRRRKGTRSEPRCEGASWPDEAIEDYSRAVVLDPNFADARHNLADLWLRKGRPEEEAAQYRELLRAKPDDAAARAGLAKALEALGGNVPHGPARN